MPRAIEILMNEHRVIEKVLASMETFLDMMYKGLDNEKPVLRDYVRFFQGFADRCHHGKEEERLFRTMNEHGLSMQFGPLATMLHEHDVGRKHVGALAAVADGGGRLTAKEKNEVRAHAHVYVQLLREHIQKEDQILFPMAQDILPRAVLESLAAEFDSFEQETIGPGTHEELHELADRLLAQFPPDPLRSAHVGHGAPCCGHG